MNPFEFAMTIVGTGLHILFGILVGNRIGTRYTSNSYSKKFTIISKMDFFRIIGLSTIWELFLLALCLKQICYYCNKAIKYWRALPFHNPQ